MEKFILIYSLISISIFLFVVIGMSIASCDLTDFITEEDTKLTDFIIILWRVFKDTKKTLLVYLIFSFVPLFNILFLVKYIIFITEIYKYSAELKEEIEKNNL